MSDDTSLILCYNRGCAAKFDPAKNPEGVLFLNYNQYHCYLLLVYYLLFFFIITKITF